jgi:hypothetical protein
MAVSMESQAPWATKLFQHFTDVKHRHRNVSVLVRGRRTCTVFWPSQPVLAGRRAGGTPERTPFIGLEGELELTRKVSAWFSEGEDRPAPKGSTR